MKSMISKLIHGNCLEKMKSIPDGSIDFVLTDPPYGTTACKWDSIIPLDEMWKQIKRVIKPNAAIVMMACQPFTSALVMSNPQWFKYDWVWRKPKGTGHLNAKKQPMRDKEDILVFYKEQCLYNPQMTVGEPYKAKPGKSKRNGEDCYGIYKDVREDNNGLRYPKQVLDISIQERMKDHPTQKPLALMEYFIETYSLEGDTVLDFAMGSGTTGVACKMLKRHFIGIELNDLYFQKAQDRVLGAECLFEKL